MYPATASAAIVTTDVDVARAVVSTVEYQPSDWYDAMFLADVMPKSRPMKSMMMVMIAVQLMLFAQRFRVSMPVVCAPMRYVPEEAS